MGVLEAGALVIGVALALRTGELNQQLLEAVKRGDARNVELLLTRGALVDARSAYGRTALDVAAGKGHLDVVKLLIKHKANVNAHDSFYHATPLTWAAMSHRKEVVKALLEAGATGGESLLLDAVREKDIDLARLVLEKGKPKRDTLDAALEVVPADAPVIIQALKKAGAKPAVPSYSLDAATLQSYAGSYEGQGAEVSLVPDKGRLLVKFGEQTFYTLSPVGKTQFKAIGQAGVTVAINVKADRADGFSIKTAGNTIKFTRSQARKADSPKQAPADEAPVHVATPMNWPSFRGPNASGVADGQMPPTSWDAEKGTNIWWKTPIPGLGHSCPVVWGDRIFVTTAISGDPNSKFRPGQYGDVDSVNDNSVHSWRVYCVDKRTGQVRWERTAHEGAPKVKRHTKGSHANPTLATDGKHLIACFGSEGLYCYDLDGSLLWHRDLGVLDSGWFFDSDYQWGFASSPIIYKGLVIVQCDIGKNSFIAAYNIEDGNRVWITPRDETPSWGTPTLFEGKNRVELVTNATKFIRGYDPATGKELWRLGRNSEITVGTPVSGDGLIFVTGGYPPVRPVYAIRAGASGDITLPKGKTSNDFVAWSNDKNGTYMPTPIVYRDYLYTCNNNGLVTCYECKTGKQVYQERVRGRGGYTASPVAADGKLYFTSEEGGVQVVKAGPKLEPLSSNPIGDVCMATPAISDGMIFIRSQHYLFGIGRRALAKVERSR
jgi:outer membrane protein assembly factor BamB